MPVISSFYGIIIYLYFEDHNPPHFHVKYNEFKAIFSIETLGITKGKLPAKAHALVVEWASLHNDELKRSWELAKANKEFNNIEPLM